MEPHSQTLIPKLSYPDHMEPHSQTLIDQCSIFNNFALTTGFYWSNTLLLKSPVVMQFPNSHTQTPEPRFQTHSQTPISRPHRASFPNSHTQTPIPRPHRASFPNSHSQTLVPRPHRALLFPSTVLCTSSKRFGVQKSASLL